MDSISMADLRFELPAYFLTGLERIHDGTTLLLFGWILLAVSTVMLLIYRLVLRHHDRQLLRFSPNGVNSLHSALQSRMTFIDRWGVSLTILTIGIAVYEVLFLFYVVYQSLEKIAGALLRLLSLI